MGCCNLNNSSLRSNQVIPEREPLNKVQKEYNQAIELCEQDCYEDALKILQKVKNQHAEFPFINKNIDQCRRLISAKQVYDEGEKLLRRGLYLQALEKYEEVEKLQKKFKGTRQRIEQCRVSILKEKESNAPNKKREEEHKQLLHQNQKLIQDFQKLLQEKKKQLAMVAELEKKNREYQLEIDKYKQQLENKTDKQSNPPQPKEMKISICLSSVEGPISKLPIYFICTKNPKCQERKENQFFKHSVCGTNAYFHADGMISCFNNCATFTIKNALFCCKTNFVCQDDHSLLKDDYEQISSMPLLADFVEDCLIKDNHAEKNQNDFRAQVGGGALLLLLL